MASIYTPSLPPPSWHDVFLSSRGDTLHGFTNHLRCVLRKNRVGAFIDNRRLQRGDEISTDLLTAIEESRISVVNFSKDYAGSRLCLDELVKILECRVTHNQIVLPVFYDVEPSDVRHQTGPFAEAFKKHEASFDGTSSVQKWRDALFEASNLPGYNLSEFKSEAALTQKIVNEILKKLGRTPIIDNNLDNIEQYRGDEEQDSSSSSSKIYDVYLSFRGEDTHHSFTSHLYDVLLENKINDHGLLLRGDEISPALLNAIERSRISVIIFSKHYAGSRLCLGELVQILECREKHNQIVIPVYYDIKPSLVRHQTGPFAEAFKKHEASFGETSSVLKWRVALTEASNIPGYNLSEFKSEAELTQVIVNEILKKLDKEAIHEPKPSSSNIGGGGGGEEVIHDPKITAEWFQRITAEKMFVAICFILEFPSVVFDELSSEHKPQYVLASMVMSFLTMLICIIQLVHQCQKRRVGWKQKAKILWPDLVGLSCVILQSIFIAIDYRLHLRNINDPIAISIWPIIFSFLTMFSTLFKEFPEKEASTKSTCSTRASAVLRVNIV